ncbi:hypothetical protein P9112_013135 [Eukaryota sp. TZLM1-RC]
MLSFSRKPKYEAREIRTSNAIPSVTPTSATLVQNVIRNQKYSIPTFVPLVLFHQFKYFFNLFFLIIALTQFIPVLQIGFLFTYVSPLALVLTVTLFKEGYDDYKRYQRDKQENGQRYIRYTAAGTEEVPSSALHVGDVIKLTPNRRIPADCILLKTSEKTGASFIRTDQLDGETDWKLRHAIPSTQSLSLDHEVVNLESKLYAEAPRKEIYEFIGTFQASPTAPIESLSLENTLWGNTVLATGTCVCMVIYTGKETRVAMNSTKPKAKSGLLDWEINKLSKMLFSLLVLLSFISVFLKTYYQGWADSTPIYFFRFLLLLSAIIPISMRVNLDMGKTVYSLLMMTDKKIPGSVVRSSGIPEELGRIEYFFTDKTGTLTQNEMVFKKLHLGSICFNRDSLEDVSLALKDYFNKTSANDQTSQPSVLSMRAAKSHHMSHRVAEVVFSIALCHNVTPVYPDGEAKTAKNKTLQAASPDEVALVKFSDFVGLSLVDRDLTTITLQNRFGKSFGFEVLYVFPFTSERKRMGIIVRNTATGKVTYYQKGADVVMAKIVNQNEWLDEEVGNMAREGLRTLVFAKKDLSEAQLTYFANKYSEAKASIKDRQAKVNESLVELEQGMELLAISGVEDKLQDNVRATLELLRNANVKVWMLTGDKVETATCIAVSARLAARSHVLFTFTSRNVSQARKRLDQFRAVCRRACLIIDGASLAICLECFPEEFVAVASQAPAVCCCRCSPQQKADVVNLVKTFKKKCCLSIGDGNNDCPMIRAADFGIGIEGKEGKQAALAADVSIKQFSYVADLMFWHGRNSYRRSARLAQFVIHRGLIISLIQGIFSLVFFYSPLPLFNGWLLTGYSTYYTMFPVFSLILDEDVDRDAVITYPELYRELQKGRLLSGKTFGQWVFQSLFQASVIIFVSLQSFEGSLFNISSITFTALILIEMLNLSLEMHKYHYLMVVAQVSSIFVYAVSIILLHNHFDLLYISSWGFIVNLLVTVACAYGPVYLLKTLWLHLHPDVAQKLR